MKNTNQDKKHFSHTNLMSKHFHGLSVHFACRGGAVLLHLFTYIIIYLLQKPDMAVHSHA